jgi:hypothetical protein
MKSQFLAIHYLRLSFLRLFSINELILRKLNDIHKDNNCKKTLLRSRFVESQLYEVTYKMQKVYEDYSKDVDNEFNDRYYVNYYLAFIRIQCSKILKQQKILITENKLIKYDETIKQTQYYLKTNYKDLYKAHKELIENRNAQQRAQS